MATPLTVDELYTFCKELRKQGHGKKFCGVTTDEEGNDWRPMWFKPTSEPQQVKEMMEYSQSGFGGYNPENIVMFG